MLNRLDRLPGPCLESRTDFTQKRVARLGWALFLAATTLLLGFRYGFPQQAVEVEQLARGDLVPPRPQLALPCVVEDVVDGDTLTVACTLRFRVRLLDCWAAEIRTKDAIAKAFGLEAKQTLTTLAAGKPGLLVISLDDASRLDDVLSLGRVLGHVQVAGQDVSATLVARKQAFVTKSELEAELARRRGSNGTQPP